MDWPFYSIYVTFALALIITYTLIWLVGGLVIYIKKRHEIKKEIIAIKNGKKDNFGDLVLDRAIATATLHAFTYDFFKRTKEEQLIKMFNCSRKKAKEKIQDSIKLYEAVLLRPVPLTPQHKAFRDSIINLGFSPYDSVAVLQMGIHLGAYYYYLQSKQFNVKPSTDTTFEIKLFETAKIIGLEETLKKIKQTSSEKYVKVIKTFKNIIENSMIPMIKRTSRAHWWSLYLTAFDNDYVSQGPFVL